jgi:polysaccharide export outer membrane protein
MDDRTTIIDALASAGDMTDFAKRDSVSVIRVIDGSRELGKISLLNREVFNSPYFYIKNGDVIYVEPFQEKNVRYVNNTKQQSLQSTITILSIFTTTITLILTLIR